MIDFKDLRRKILTGAFFLSAFAGAVIFHDITHFYVKKYRLKSNKINKKYRFVVLADLHGVSYGKENEKLLKEIEKLNPEAVYIPGDMITAHEGLEFDETIAFLEKLAKKYPVYYASGNHEYRMRIYPEKYGDMSERYEKAILKTGIVRMYTGTCDTNRKDVKVSAIEIDKGFYKKVDIPTMPRDYTIQKIGMADSDCYHILLAHNPEYFKNYAQTDVDLVLSGHVHGGLAVLPFIGGIISPRLRLFPYFDGGLFYERNTTMILSRGLGFHTLPIRFFNPGELVYVEVDPE